MIAERKTRVQGHTLTWYSFRSFQEVEVKASHKKLDYSRDFLK
jgi:hypothetical protein